MAHKQVCKRAVSVDMIGLIGDDVLAYCETKGYNPLEVALSLVALSEFLPDAIGLIPSELADFKRDCRKSKNL
jgi:hypothetical protein